MYEDRLQAGRVLAAQLKKYERDPAVILAIPRGGIPVAYAVARELGFPIDIVPTKKIGHPMHKEYAIGAVSLTDSYIVPHEYISPDYIQSETERIRTQLRQMYNKFMGDKKPENLEGKTAVIIDDGIATGNTLIATVQLLKKSGPAKIIVAAPVASRRAVNTLSKKVTEVVCPLVPEEFIGVGGFYEDFSQVTDEEAMAYLNSLRAEQAVE